MQLGAWVKYRSHFTHSNFQEKGPWTAVQVTISKQLMLRSKNLLSVCAGKIAGKLEQERRAARVRPEEVSSTKRV